LCAESAPSLDYTHVHSAFKNFAGYTVGGINDAQNAALAARSAALVAYVNSYGGSLVSLGQSSLPSAYTWLPTPLVQKAMNFVDVEGTTMLPYISSTSTGSSLSHMYWHGYWTGPTNWASIYNVMAFKAGECTAINGPTQSCSAALLCNFNTWLSKEDCYNGERARALRPDQRALMPPGRSVGRAECALL